MLSPAQMVYASIHGAGEHGGVCWLCAGTTAPTRPVLGWLPESFTATPYVRAPESGVVCEACVFLCCRTSPVPGREPKPGKLFGGNWRNYSHFGEAGVVWSASKGEKPLIRDFLCRPKAAPWFCAVAESGQKHVLPMARMNLRAGRHGVVHFEDSPLAWGEAAIKALIDTIALLDLGVTKAEVESGSYWPRTWMAHSEAVRSFEAENARWRGGRLFDLVVFLAQRGEVEGEDG